MVVCKQGPPPEAGQEAAELPQNLGEMCWQCQEAGRVVRGRGCSSWENTAALTRLLPLCAPLLPPSNGKLIADARVS